MTRAVEAFWDDLSNWYVRRSRQRFWEGDRAAFATLHHALVQCLRIMAPVTPFITEEMWDNLVARGCGADAPASVHLAGLSRGRRGAASRRGLLAPMADVRAACELGHRARAEAKLRVRQPLASAVVACGDAARLEALVALSGEIASELNVKAVTTTTDLASLVEQQVVPNFRALGPRLGAKVQEVRAALAAGDYELGADGVVQVAGEQLARRRVRAALALARGLRGADRRLARGRDRHARDRRARARGHGARRRALPPERPQGARLRRLRPHRGAATPPTSAAPPCSPRTASGSRARCSRRASSRTAAASTASPPAAPRSRSRSSARERRAARRRLRLRRAADRLRGALGRRRAARRRGARR